MSFIEDIGGSIGLSDLFYNPKKDREKIGEGAEAGMEAYENLKPSDFQNISLSGPQEAKDVQYTPAEFHAMEAAKQGDSSYNDINVDPSLVGAQKAQLAALQELRDKGGMNAQDTANLSQIQNEQNQNERAQRMAILQNARMRGVGGGGNEMLAQLAAQQGAAQRANESGLNVAAQMQNRALQAGQAGAQLAGTMEGQQYNEAAQKAAAIDAINRFNAQNTTAASQYNAGQQNQLGLSNAGQNLAAQQFNAQKAQGVNNAQAEAGNQSQMHNKYTIPQTQFQQQATRAGGLSGAGNNMAGIYAGQSQQKQANQQGLLGGAIGLGTKAYPGISSMFGGEETAGSVAGGGISGNIGALAAVADKGGKVPGAPAVHGDSLKNDKVPVVTSPGEVVVPRSVTHASPEVIAKYVKHAPSVFSPEQEKEAMLSALKHMRGH